MYCLYIERLKSYIQKTYKMKKLSFIPIIFILIQNGMSQVNTPGNTVKSFYDYTAKSIDGKDFPLSSLKGRYFHASQKEQPLGCLRAKEKAQ